MRNDLFIFEKCLYCFFAQFSKESKFVHCPLNEGDFLKTHFCDEFEYRNTSLSPVLVEDEKKEIFDFKNEIPKKPVIRQLDLFNDL